MTHQKRSADHRIGVNLERIPPSGRTGVRRSGGGEKGVLPKSNRSADSLVRALRTPLKTVITLAKWITRTQRSALRAFGQHAQKLRPVWTPDSIPAEFAALLQQGRELNTRLIVDTQRPELVNPSVTGQCTGLVCLKLLPSGQSDCPVKTVARLGADGNLVQQLPLGSFIGYNRLEVPFTTLRGKVF